MACQGEAKSEQVGMHITEGWGSTVGGCNYRRVGQSSVWLVLA